mmetsp:Transcript_38901/g.97284  ORF Transcript_38901/g.97284 Transcript_38901/m.97284 type:complete len:236 (-) Transcript_38901:689-1396(-)
MRKRIIVQVSPFGVPFLHAVFIPSQQTTLPACTRSKISSRQDQDTQKSGQRQYMILSFRFSTCLINSLLTCPERANQMHMALDMMDEAPSVREGHGGHAFLDRRTGPHSLDVCLHVLVLEEFVSHAVELVDADEPWKDGEVGDADVTAYVLLALQLRVEHLPQPLALGEITLLAIGEFLFRLVLGRVFPEVTHLAQHRSEASHLPHEPLGDLVFLVQVGRHELPTLLSQIQQDGA